MKFDRKIILSIFYMIIGIVLTVIGMADVADEFWSGMGAALITVSIVRMVQLLRLHKNENYRENFEIEMSDERKRFIRNKAWAWSGYLFVLAVAVLSIVFKIVGQDLLSVASGFAVCMMMILYWICYFILSKKY